MKKFYSKVLTLNTKKSLKEIKSYNLVGEFYLGGGTALALHLGHRLSKDLDFFTLKSFNETLLIQTLSETKKFSLEKRDTQTVLGILESTKISFFRYNYPLLSPALSYLGINIASIPDLICMKIDTISARGSKRDFIDLYFALKNGFSLSEALKLFEIKYTSVKYNMTHVLKSLIYFTDAEDEPMPVMLKVIDWSKLKETFIREVNSLS